MKAGDVGKGALIAVGCGAGGAGLHDQQNAVAEGDAVVGHNSITSMPYCA